MSFTCICENRCWCASGDVEVAMSARIAELEAERDEALRFAKIANRQFDEMQQEKIDAKAEVARLAKALDSCRCNKCKCGRIGPSRGGP